MIYHASKSQFLHHALSEDIEGVMSRHYHSATGYGVGPSEIQSWKHSLLEMAKVLSDEEVPGDAGVAIAYQLPQTSKRIDFVITGEDVAARTKVIIVELKQWSESRFVIGNTLPTTHQPFDTPMPLNARSIAVRRQPQ